MSSHGKHRAYPSAGNDAAPMCPPVALERAECAFRLVQGPAFESANRVTYPLTRARRGALP